MAEWTIAPDWKLGSRQLTAHRFKSYRNRHFMFDWLKKLFFCEEQKTDEVIVHFVLPDGKKFDIVALKLTNKDISCPIHKDFRGTTPPTNNCNLCWEYHSQKRRWHN